MAQIISKEEVEKLMNIKGEVRGVALKAELEYIRDRKGEDGLKKLEDTLKELGHPLTFKEVSTAKFYPLGLWGLLLLCIQRLFGYKDEDFREVGQFDVKLSIFIRLFLQSFLSLERAFGAAQIMWKKYFTVGDLKVVELNKKDRYIIVRLENFALHPLHCQTMIGQFTFALKMILKGGGTCEETKCTFKGDKYHEFLLRW